MTQPTQHATRADIQAILAARKAATAQSIPALPQKQASSTPATPQAAQAQPRPQAQSVPVAPTPQPVSEADLTAFLGVHLPQIQAKAVALATPPFVWTEMLELGQVVSKAVSDGLPMARDTDAHQIVLIITGYAYDHYLVPALPAAIKPFSGLLRPLVLQGIEAAYQLTVKRKLSK